MMMTRRRTGCPAPASQTAAWLIYTDEWIHGMTKRSERRWRFLYSSIRHEETSATLQEDRRQRLPTSSTGNVVTEKYLSPSLQSFFSLFWLLVLVLWHISCQVRPRCFQLHLFVITPLDTTRSALNGTFSVHTDAPVEGSLLMILSYFQASDWPTWLQD